MHVPTLLPQGTSIVHCVGHAENCTPVLTPSSYLPSQSLSIPSQMSGAPGHVPHAVSDASFSSILPSQSSSTPGCEQVSLTWPHTICWVTGVDCGKVSEISE